MHSPFSLVAAPRLFSCSQPALCSLLVHVPQQVMLGSWAQLPGVRLSKEGLQGLKDWYARLPEGLGKQIARRAIKPPQERRELETKVGPLPPCFEGFVPGVRGVSRPLRRGGKELEAKGGPPWVLGG